jgi:3-(3-hydroxy-phenyl)propionate hydroxylase
MEHTRAYIELAVDLGGVIQATDPEVARKRDAQMIASPTMLKPITPRLGPGLHGDADPPAGTRAEQPHLADGRLLDDCVGYRFALLAQPHVLTSLSQADQKILNDHDVAVVSATGEAGGYLDRLGKDAIVVRPDRHILGLASTAPELDAVLARLPALRHEAPAHRAAASANS